MTETRQSAWNLLCRNVTSEVLLKHCLAVEIAMRAYAGKFGDDVEYWGSVGLLHDVDFEKFPHEHPHHAGKFLLPKGMMMYLYGCGVALPGLGGRPQPIAKDVAGGRRDDGFIIACALVRPDRSLENLEVKSVMKKMKDKAFARAVNRETLTQGAAEMGVDFTEHVAFLIQALAAAVKHPDYQKVPLI